MTKLNFEQVEHYAIQWSKRFRRVVDKRFDQKPLQECSTEERLGLYDAATVSLVTSAMFAFLDTKAIKEEGKLQQIQSSIAKSIQKAVEEWMRTMPKELRTIRFVEEE